MMSFEVDKKNLFTYILDKL